jgi:ATP-dependent Clp protease ATP-binding subunit ClpC|tara:strand:- start:2 stop:2446 length:2445 start_codon:yes stop_codon:yes gene_type:complete
MGLTDFNLTPKAKKGLKDSQKFAEANGHNLVTTAHLVYGCLINISDSCAVRLKSYGISFDGQSFIKLFKKYAAKNKDYFQASKGQGGWHEDVNEIIFFAKDFSDNFDSYFIGIEHILYTILDMEGPFVEYMKANGIDTIHAKDIIETYVLETSIPPTDQIKNILLDPERIEDVRLKIKSKKTEGEGPLPNLSKYCVNLNERFVSQKTSKVSGRDKEIHELIEILSKKNKSNAILVGDAGVGKTAIVEGLVQKIISQESPPHMSLMQICAVDISAMIAGTKYRGEFEERFKSLIAEVEKESNIILFFDEIHTIIGAGNSEGAVDASNMLKPALARGDIKCIGATTSQEYKKFFEKDTAMKRRFDKIIVEEPSKADTKKIVMNALSYYEDFHHVKYSESDIDTIIDLCEKFLSNKKFPDKAFDIIDQLGARTKIKYNEVPSSVEEVRTSFCEFLMGTSEEDKIDEEKFTILLKDYLEVMARYGAKKGRKQKIRQKDILSVFKEKTGLSVKTIAKNTSSFNQFYNQMNGEIFGQEENIKIIHNALSCVKAGLNDPCKPLSNFLFVGSTSVGKTFTAKKIAKYFFGNERAFLQLNMSEYQDKTGISKLMGANAGYVGYEEGGLLTEYVRNNPNCVVLFDEVEKCEPKVLDILLHILDEGYATDNLNRKIDFSKTVIVMTSNVGHKEKTKRSMGFIQDAESDTDVYKKSLKKYFRPELLARVDEVIVFNELGEKELLKIIKTEIIAIKERLKDRNIEISFTKSVENYILNKIKLEKNHARQIKSAVKVLIQVPISNYIVKNRGIDKISINVVDKSLQFA